MAKTPTKTTTLKAGTARVVLTCPHCLYNLNVIFQNEQEQYNNGHDRGRGGYEMPCESCGERFVIEADTVHDIQNRALVLLGEA